MYIFLLFLFPYQTLIFDVKKIILYLVILSNFTILIFKIIPYHNSNLSALIFRLKIICQEF